MHIHLHFYIGYRGSSPEILQEVQRHVQATFFRPAGAASALRARPGPGRRRGPDGRHRHQRLSGDVEFETARDHGVEVVYIRSSYGSDGVDSALNSHYEGARAAGRKLGFYHYLTALDTESAQAQAGFFAGLIRDLDYDCRPALDFEVYRGLDRDQATAVAAAFLETLENELDVTPMLYADAYVASTRFTGALSRYPLWVAQWEVAAPDLSGTPWETWAGWQYTDLGRVAGIDGYVDRDWFTGEVLLDPGPAPQPYPYYTVRAGDTLWAIARRYHTTVAELARLNAIADPNRIYGGQVLKIPLS